MSLQELLDLSLVGRADVVGLEDATRDPASPAVLTFGDVEARVPVERHFEPRREHGNRYGELFAQYLELYRRNRSIFQRLNRDRQQIPR